MRADHSTVYLDGLFLMEFVLAVLAIVDLVPLPYGGRTSINNPLLLQVEIRRLILSPEVLNVKLEAAELDRVATCQSMVVLIAILALIGIISILLLGL